MILKRTELSTVLHAETGLTFQVFLVDCFCEQFDTLGSPSFIFEERYYETSTGQRVIADPKQRKGVWIVITEVDPFLWYVKELT